MKFRKLPSLAALITAALAHDERAQQELYELFNARFQRFASRFLSRQGCCVPEQHSFGVVSAAWGNIFNSLGALWSPANFNSWALQIVRNDANEHLRQCIRQQHEVSFDSLKKKSSDESGEKEIPFDPPSLVDDDTVISNALLADEILHIAADISPKLYAILNLQLVEGLALPAIAKHIGETYDNTRTIRSRGLQELRRRVTGKMNELKKRLDKKKKKKNDSEE